MNFLRLHCGLFAAFVYLLIFAPLAQWLLDQQSFRLFYALHLGASLSVLYGLFYLGEALRQALIKRGWLKNFYSGFDWVAALMLGVAALGNLAILGALLRFQQPWIYQLSFFVIVLVSAFWVQPERFTRPFQRMFQATRGRGWQHWLWLLPMALLSLRLLTTFLPNNGTEQLHNTLPYAKLLFWGINFYEYNQDNHFLLLGLYESTGPFWLALTGNDFSYHILGQQLTFLLTMGALSLLLGSLPWLLRRWPLASIVMAAWPATLNFAPTDSVAFKPDWLAFLAAFLATGLLVRQWLTRKAPWAKRSEPFLWAILLFCAIAVCHKLTAVNYVLFLLPATVILSVIIRGKLKPHHWLTPVIFLLGCSLFFGKNTLWLGNPLYPGFQTIFPKPERLAQTATFNQFKINKVTKKVPDALDYVRGYTRFFEPRHHSEFFLVILLAGWLAWKGLGRSWSGAWLGFFFIYISLICFMFYPDIYQRYVAFAYIIFLSLTLMLWLWLCEPRFSKRFRHMSLGGFALLMLSHAGADGNFQDSLPWWSAGVSPREHRIQQDSLTKFYFEINEGCSAPGTLLNRKWRSFHYANFTTINLTDLPGEPYERDYYDKHGVNFVITPTTGYIAKEIEEATARQSWFTENFKVVSTSGDTLLWKRQSFQGCSRWP